MRNARYSLSRIRHPLRCFSISTGLKSVDIIAFIGLNLRCCLLTYSIRTTLPLILLLLRTVLHTSAWALIVIRNHVPSPFSVQPYELALSLHLGSYSLDEISIT